jgi:adenylate kinase family enzyme
MQRIAIIGPSGSGKSTLARRVGEILGIDVIHLDRVHWRAGWVEPPEEEFEEDVRRALATRERWIIDGNYSSKQSITLAAADTVVWLDFPRYLCLWRIIRRVLEYSGLSRPDLPSGCPEQPDWEFTKWVWNFPRRERPKIIEKLSRLRDDQRVTILKNQREVEAFVRGLSIRGEDT